MPEILLGLLVGVLLGARYGLDPQGVLVTGGVVALLLYMGSCYVFPYRRCWLCGGETRRHDERGNYRYRWFACFWCRSERDNKRLGARVMGRG